MPIKKNSAHELRKKNYHNVEIWEKDQKENSHEKVSQSLILLSTHIREYDSTLYVGLARAVSPTNTNFRLTFLLTRLQEALYEDLAV